MSALTAKLRIRADLGTIQPEHDLCKAAADRIEALEAKLLEAAATCDQWADDSGIGGWSTHQVKANRELANELRRAAS